MITGKRILTAVLVFTGSVAFAQVPIDSPILSEFMPNPMGELETEWIELYNPTVHAVNLTLYKIGDALGLRSISDTGMYLQPGEYIVLAEDPDRFLSYYGDFTGIVTSPNGWQILNNYDGEVVRLADQSGRTVDSIFYENGFPDNRSWERYINPEGESYWGGSFAASGSTPGEPNLYAYPRTSSISLTVDPDPFSPDGDGFEDVTAIKYDVPEAEGLELVIYDIAGRKVRTIFDTGASIPGEFIWDGRGDDGRTLPVGIYIIYARVEGGKTMESKKTVVITSR
jgi:hypothetical protein